MSVLRGKGSGLEIVLAGRDFDDALSELEGRLTERPGFYKGTSAKAVFGRDEPTMEQLGQLRVLLEDAGVTLQGVIHGAAEPSDVEELVRRRAMRPRRNVELSESAKSLVADFAGARADIAHRRKRGETSVRRVEPRPPTIPSAIADIAAQVAAAHVEAQVPIPGTLYHVGTLRGGQSLQQVGNIVVIGDVNPGAELIATGDIVVFGALRGVAHAGAQGDVGACVYALELAATQLRIATSIAADLGKETKDSPGAHAAAVKDGRIVIVPRDRLEHIQMKGTTH